MNAAELTDSLAEAWDALLHTPLFGIALTLAVAVLSRRLWLAARQTALLTPVLVTIVLVAAFLALTGIDYETYMIGGSYLTFLLGPATVALAVPLYRAGPDIRKLLLPVAVGVTVGSLTAMVSAVLIVRAMGGDAALAATDRAQPLLFAVQHGVVSALAEQGIRPDLCLGHSVGEVAAACAAGLLGLGDAARLIHARSRHQHRTRGAGRMAALGVSAEEALPVLAGCGTEAGAGLEIAAVNGRTPSPWPGRRRCCAAWRRPRKRGAGPSSNSTSTTPSTAPPWTRCATGCWPTSTASPPRRRACRWSRP